MLTLLALTLILVLCIGIAYANPEGGVVAAGSASIDSSNPDSLVITQTSDKAVIDWRSFNIAVNQSTHFTHPTKNAITLNRVNSDFASQIDGNLTANGNLIIVNPNGMIFGPNSVVDVGGLIASSTNILNDDFMKAGSLKFNLPGHKHAEIVNEGKIKIKEAGVLGFVAPHVENAGSIKGRLNKITMSSGDRFTLDMYGDNLIELDITDQLDSQSVRMSGEIESEGAYIELSAANARNAIDSVIDVSGSIVAASIAEKEGKIVLLGRNDGAEAYGYEQDIETLGRDVITISGEISASSSTGVGGKIIAIARETLITDNAILTADGLSAAGEIYVGGAFQGGDSLPVSKYSFVGADAKISASGIDGDGGLVVVWSDEYTIFNGDIKAEGGIKGLGGLIETSGGMLDVNGTASTKGDIASGDWLLDPYNITINTAGSSNMSAGPPFTSTADSAVLNVSSITTAMNAGTSVTVSTGGGGVTQLGDITVDTNITMGAVTGTPTLTLNAHQNIFITGRQITSSSGAFNVVLASNQSGNGGAVQLNSASVISTRGGNITIGGGATPSTGYAVGTTTSSNRMGVILNNTQLTAAGGNIIINGQGFSNDPTNDNRMGIYLLGGTQVTTTGSGTITINGKGGDSTRNYADGIYLNNATIQAADGAIDITATGGNNGNWMTRGMTIDNSSTSIKTTGTGNINITATATNSGQINNGFQANSGTFSVVNGNLTINGTGGNYVINTQHGIYLNGSSVLIESTGTGTISLIGTGKGDSVGSGIFFNAGAIKSANGNISLTGTATATGTQGYGVYMNSSTTVESTGSAAISITGTSGTGNGTNDGIYITNASVKTVTGNITLTGNSKGLNAADDGIELINAAIVSSTGTANIILDGTATTGLGIRTSTTTTNVIIGNAADTGTITLTGNSMNLGSLTLTTAGNVYLAQKTAGNTINIATSGTSHIIPTTVFSGLPTTNNLYIGDSNSGAITVSSAYTYTRPVIFDTNGANITVSAAQSAAAASRTNFRFMDPAVVSGNLDTSAASGGTPTIQFDSTLSLAANLTTSDNATTNGNITITGNLTLSGSGGTRTLTTGSGDIYIGTNPATTTTANANTLAFSGTGILYLGSAFTSTNTPLTVNRNTILTGNSSIETGTGAISLLNVTMGTYTFGFGTGTGGVTLNGSITSAANNPVSLSNRNLTLTGNSSISNGTGAITLRDVAMGTNTFTLVGTGNLNLNGAITSTDIALDINRNTYLQGDSSINTGTTPDVSIYYPMDMSSYSFKVLNSRDTLITAKVDSVGGSGKEFSVNAQRNIFITNGVNIASSAAALNIILNADYDGGGAGAVRIIGTGTGASLAVLESKGGSITIGGGSGGTGAGNAVGNVVGGTTYAYGVELSYAQLSASGGHISIRGQGYSDNSTNRHGIYLYNGSSVSTTGTGNITFNASAVTGTTSGDGIRIEGSTVSLANGALSMTGAGGAGGGDGVSISSASTISSTGSGTISITGTTTSGVGIRTATGANVLGDATDTGNITLKADTMNLANLTTTTAGHVYILRNTSGAMTLNTGAGSHIVTTGVISAISSTSGNLYIGDTNSTSLTVSSAYSYTRPVIFDTNGGTITVSAIQDTVAASKGSFRFMDPAVVTANIDTSAASGGTPIIQFDSTLSLSANLTSSNGTTTNGNITVTGNLTLPGTGATRTLTSGSGHIYIGTNPATTTTANTDTLVFSGTGLLYLGSAYTSTNTPLDVNRNTVLTGNSSINTGTAAISLRDVAMGTYSFSFGGTGVLNLNGAITSTNVDFTINRNTTITGTSSIDLDSGIFTVSNPITMGANAFDVNDAGTVNINANISATGGGGQSITIKSRGSIIVGSAADISSTTGAFPITLQARHTGGASGAIQIRGTDSSTLSVIDSRGGAIILGGGATPATLSAIGTTTELSGVELSFAQILAKGGNITINGSGHTVNGVGRHGVYLYNGSTVTTTGTGTITMSGSGASGGGANHGIFLDNASSIEGADGAITLTPAGATSGAGNHGLYLDNLSYIKSTGAATGTIGITATTGGTNNTYATYLNTTSYISTASGNVTLSAISSGTGTGNAGLYLGSSSYITTTGTGNLGITGKSSGTSGNAGIWLNSSNYVSSASSGTITLSGTSTGSTTGNYGINLVGSSYISGTSGTVSLTGATAGTNTNTSINFTSANYITSATGNITLSATSTATGTGNLGLSMAGASYVKSTGTATIGITNTVAGTGSSSGAQLTGASYITSATGDVSLTSTTNSTGTSNYGIYATTNSYITSTGAAKLTISGTGGGGTTGNYGILLDSSYIYANNGNSTITGTTNGTATTNHGIYLTNGSKIEAQGSGTLAVSGTGKGTDTNYGIFVAGATSYMQTATSALTLTGTSTGTGTGNAGVYLDVSSYVTSTGAGGNISVTGSSSGTSGNAGIWLNSSNYVSSANNGTITLSGTSTGTTTGNFGINLVGSSYVSGTSGTVSVTGATAGTNTNTAINFTSGNYVTSASGNITLSSTSTATGTGNLGLSMAGASYVKSTGTATIGITNTVAGTGSSSGAQLTGASYITSGTGDISITSTTNSTGTNNYGIYATTNSYITSTGAAKLTIAGTGGGGTTGNHGIFLDSSYIYANNGNSTITGTTNGTTITNYGIYLMNGSKFEAQGSGTLGVSGTGKGTDTNYGIFVTGATSYMQTATSALTLTGTSTGSGTGNAGLYFDSSSYVTSTGAGGNISVTGSSSGTSGNAGIWLNSSNYVSSASSGTITLSGTSTGSTTGNYGINLVGSSYISGTSGTVSLTGATAGTNTNTSINFTSANYITSATGNITLSATSTATGTGNLGLSMAGASYVKSTGTATIGITNTVAGTGSSSGAQLTGASYITSATGDVSLTSTTNSTGTSNYGIYATTNSYITSTGAAKLTISGTGGGGTTGNHGIYLNNGYIAAMNGDSTVTGTTNGTAATNYGIYIAAGGAIKAQGTGTLAVSGTGKGTNSNYGIYATGVGTNIETVNSALTLTGASTGTGTDNYGIYIAGSAEARSTSATNSAPITLTGTGSNSGTSNNYGIYIGGGHAKTTGSDLTITGTGGAGSAASNIGIVIDGTGTAQSSSSGKLIIAGTGGAGTSTSSAHGIYLNNGYIYAHDGNSTITGTAGGSTTTNHGIFLAAGGAIKAQGSGTLGISGTGKGTNSNYGLYATGAGTNIETVNSALTLTGTSTGTGTDNYGIYIAGSAEARSTSATTSAPITLAGTGSNSGSSSNYGVYIGGGHAKTTGSDLTITGTGGAGSAASNIGIVIDGTGSAQSSSSGKLIIAGTGGAGTSTSSAHGISLNNGYIYAQDGNSTITGTAGGSTTTNHGIYLAAGGAIETKGAAVLGVSGTGKGTNSNVGIYATGASYIQTVSTALTLTGVSDGTGTGNRGITLESGAYVNSTTSGALNITGTSGTGSGTNDGIFLSNSSISSVAGNVSITGDSRGGNAADYGINITNTSTIASTGAANIILDGVASTGVGIRSATGANVIGDATDTGIITLTADKMDLAALTITNLNNINIIQKTAATDLAISTAGTSHIMAAGVFSGMTSTGNLYLGDAATGNLIISSAYSYARPVILNGNALGGSTITISAAQSAVAASKASFRFMLPATVSANIDTSAANAVGGTQTIQFDDTLSLSGNLNSGNGPITVTGAMTLPAAGVDRTLTSGTGVITLHDTTANDNTLKFAGTGLLKFGGDFISTNTPLDITRDMQLTADSTIETGSAEISFLNVAMGNFSLALGVGTGGVNLNGNIVSTNNKNIDFGNRDLTLKGDSSISNGTGIIDINNVIMAGNDLTFIGTGKINLNGNITSATDAVLNFGGRDLDLQDNTTIDTKAGAVTLGNVTMNDKTLTFGGTGDLNLNGTITSDDVDLSFGAQIVKLAGNSVIETKAGKITLGDVAMGNYSLDLGTGTGGVILNGDITSNNGALNFGNRDLTLAGDSSISTGTGDVSLNNVVMAGNDLTFAGTGKVNLDGNITSATDAILNFGGRDLDLQANTTIDTKAGAVTLGNVTMNDKTLNFGGTGDLNLNGDITSTNVALSFGNQVVKLVGNSTINTGTGTVTLGDVAMAGNTLTFGGTGDLELNGDITSTNVDLSFGSQKVKLIGNSTINTGTGTVTLSDVAMGTNTLTFGGTGDVELDGDITSTNVALSFGSQTLKLIGNSSIETGSGVITLGDVVMSTYNLSLGTGSGGVNLNGDITSTNGALDFGNRDLTLTGDSSISTGLGDIDVNNIILGGNDLTFAGAGKININGNITSATDAALDFGGRDLTLAKNTTIDTKAGAVTLGNVTMNDKTLTFSGTGDLFLNGAITSKNVDLSFGAQVVKLAGNSSIDTGLGKITLGDVAMAANTLTFGGTGVVDLSGTITSTDVDLDLGPRTLNLIGNSTINIGLGTLSLSNLTMNDKTLTLIGGGDLYLNGDITSTNVPLTINRDTYIKGDSSVDFGNADFTLTNKLDMDVHAFEILDSKDVTINAPITSKGDASGNREVRVNARGSIYITGGGSIGSVQDKLKVILNADSDNNGTCSIVVTGTINSAGADIILGGGLDPLNNPAIGDAVSPYGVELNNAQLLAQGGNVSIRGVGYADGGVGRHGIYIHNNSLVSTTGAGTILIDGEGVTGGTSGDGVHIDDSTITIASGNFTLNGVGGVAGGEGIRLTNGASIIPSGAGAVTITGSSPTSLGIKTDTGSNLIGGGLTTGNIRLIADTMNLANLALTTSGNVYINQKTAAATMNIATAAVSHVISGATMSAISAGNLYFGDATTGALSVSTSYSFASTTIFDTNGATITISAVLDTVLASNGALRFMDPVALTADLDTSNSNGNIRFDSNLTLPMAGLTRNFSSGAGDVYFADVAANDNSITFAGTGLLKLGGDYVGSAALNVTRNIELTADSSIDTGTADIDLLAVDLKTYNLEIKGSDVFNLAGNISGTSGNFITSRDITLGSDVTIDNGAGLLDIVKIVGGGNKLTISGTGTFNLGGDITSTNTDITIDRPITLNTAVKIDNGSGILSLAGMDMGSNNVTIDGSGALYLKGKYTGSNPLSFNRIITLKGETEIDNGPADIDALQDINLDVFNLRLGTGGKLNLSASFNSVSGSLDLEKELNITKATIFNMGSGNLTLSDVNLGGNDLEFTGSGSLRLGGDINGTSGNLTFDMPTYLDTSIEINTGSGNILFKNTLDNDHDLEFDTSGSLIFLEDVGVQETLGYVTVHRASTIEINKRFIARGRRGLLAPKVKEKIDISSLINYSIFNDFRPEFNKVLLIERRLAMAKNKNLGSTEKIFANDPLRAPYSLMRTPYEHYTNPRRPLRVELKNALK